MNQYQYVHWRGRGSSHGSARETRAQQARGAQNAARSMDTSSTLSLPADAAASCSPCFLFSFLRRPLSPTRLWFTVQFRSLCIGAATLLAVERGDEAMKASCHAGNTLPSIAPAHDETSRPFFFCFLDLLSLGKTETASTRPSAGGATRWSTRAGARRRSTTTRSRASTRA